MLKLAKYRLQIFFRGSSFVMPFTVIAIFLCTMYSIKPLGVISSFLISDIFCFYIMVWIGMVTAQKENEVTEQLLYLHIQNIWKYYISKIIFFICIATLIDFICVFFPMIYNIINNYTLFDRPLTAYDIINALFLQAGCAYSGAAIGGLFHPRVIKDRKMAVILTFFLSILSICKPSIIIQFPIMRFIMWLLPPIMLPSQIYGNSEYFDITKTIGIFTMLCIYALIYSIIKNVLCQKNKF